MAVSMSTTSEDSTGEVTELLQQLIRNECVNDGTPDSGGEIRSADLLQTYLEGSGVDLERYEPEPGRASLVGRIEGRNPEAPTLLLMGHTDVVPVNEAGWRHDPFGGEVIDGEVWGRGAVDMLNLTASMAVAFRRLAASGFQPDGTLIYLAVADEEALGTYGAEWLTDHETDAIAADYVITESGGIPVPGAEGTMLPVMVGEKGAHWARLRVAGTPGHGSQPYRTDNALVTAATVVQRLAEYRPEAQIHDVWRTFLAGTGFPAEFIEPLLDPSKIEQALGDLPLGMGRMFHACTHTTFAPTVINGGVKTNVIPDTVDLEVDIRTLPGQTSAEVRAMLDEALGDVADRVTIDVVADDESTASPMDTPLFEALDRLTDRWYEGSRVVPMLSVGATDARFFRRQGVTSYGFGLFSERMNFEDFAAMFHGDDERVDQESLRLSVELWEALAQDLLTSTD
jgi:acetylornithine deacetylase/succinyl-diaminopimelate desuccinylase-like protein